MTAGVTALVAVCVLVVLIAVLPVMAWQSHKRTVAPNPEDER